MRWDQNIFVDDGSPDSAIFADHYVLHYDRFPYVDMIRDANIRRQDRVLDTASGDDAAAAHNGVQRHTHAAALKILCEHELGGWKLTLIGSDRPLLVVEVEEGIDRDQIHIGFPVGIQRSNIAPILNSFPVGIMKLKGIDASALDHVRDDIFSEVVGGAGLGIGQQVLTDDIRAKQVYS